MILNILLTNAIFYISAITLPVWYQAPRFWGEPRLIKNYQNWIEIYTRTGSQEFAYDCKGYCTNIDKLLPKTESLTSFEIEIQYTKNLRNGFFIQSVSPIRILHSNGNKYFCNGQLGDTLATVGWGLNYQNFVHADYLDFTLQTGLVLPSGSLCNCDEIGCIATGYNGNTGFVVNAQIALGLLDWLTIGGHTAIFNFTNCYCKFNVISYGIYGKADHLINGLSIIIATVKNQEKEYEQINWKLNTLNIFIEYDFACLHAPYRPVFGLMFDIARKGNCAIPTTMYGIYFNFIF